MAKRTVQGTQITVETINEQWVEKTNYRGVIARAGRYGVTYTHKEIAFEFATRVSPQFKHVGGMKS